MKNQNGDARSLDDVVFENRNKEYGAYAIRKTYTDNLNKALLFVFGSMVAMIILTLILPSEGTGIGPNVPGGKVTDVDSEPIIKIERIRQPQASSVRKAVRDIAPHVTTNPDPVDQAPVTEAVSGIDEGVEGGEAPEVGVVGIGTEEIGAPVVPEVQKVWDMAEVMPAYDGGRGAMIKFLSSKMRYPSIARRTEVEGSVYVSFIINTDGSVIEAKVAKGISKECDAEALRVVSMMPRWLAGRQGNVPVMVRMMLPIKFQLAK